LSPTANVLVPALGQKVAGTFARKVPATLASGRVPAGLRTSFSYGPPGPLGAQRWLAPFRQRCQPPSCAVTKPERTYNTRN